VRLDYLQQFQLEYPAVTLRLHVEALGGVAALLLDGRAQLGIGGPVATDHPDLERQDAGAVTIVPVAAPTHPLAMASGEAATRAHLQLVLTDRSTITEGQDFAVTSPRTWRLADLGAKHELLRKGIGWGNMPVDMIEEDVQAGRLIKLRLQDMPGPYRLAAMWKRDQQLGPAGSWLRHRLIEALA
jgi:DNA-binding transcriptional LysR family regulator